jgi:hypothetical protein
VVSMSSHLSATTVAALATRLNKRSFCEKFKLYNAHQSEESFAFKLCVPREGFKDRWAVATCCSNNGCVSGFSYLATFNCSRLAPKKIRTCSPKHWSARGQQKKNTNKKYVCEYDYQK